MENTELFRMALGIESPWYIDKKESTIFRKLQCQKCGNTEHYWKSDKEQYECKQCSFRTTLKSGSIMHKSKLPYRYWFIAIHLLRSTKKKFFSQRNPESVGA